MQIVPGQTDPALYHRRQWLTIQTTRRVRLVVSKCADVNTSNRVSSSATLRSTLTACRNSHRSALTTTRFLNRGVELMRQDLDDARAEAGMCGLAVRFVGS
jgi:hypothetical protein